MTVVGHWLSDTRGQSSIRCRQLEGEDEIGYEVETWANLHDLLYDILQTNNVAAKVLLHLAVGLDLHTLFSCLTK